MADAVHYQISNECLIIPFVGCGTYHHRHGSIQGGNMITITYNNKNNTRLLGARMTVNIDHIVACFVDPKTAPNTTMVLSKNEWFDDIICAQSLNEIHWLIMKARMKRASSFAHSPVQTFPLIQPMKIGHLPEV